LLLLALGLAVGAGLAGYDAWVRPTAPEQQPPVVPPKKNAPGPTVDLYGDPLPDGAAGRLGTLRWRHAGLTTFAAFPPDGKTVLPAGTDMTIRVWESPSGKELRRMGTPVALGRSTLTSTFGLQGNGFPVAVSPDGKVVAACYDSSSRIRFFDVATGEAR